MDHQQHMRGAYTLISMGSDDAEPANRKMPDGGMSNLTEAAADGVAFRVIIIWALKVNECTYCCILNVLRQYAHGGVLGLERVWHVQEVCNVATAARGAALALHRGAG